MLECFNFPSFTQKTSPCPHRRYHFGMSNNPYCRYSTPATARPRAAPAAKNHSNACGNNDENYFSLSRCIRITIIINRRCWLASARANGWGWFIDIFNFTASIPALPRQRICLEQVSQTMRHFLLRQLLPLQRLL